MADEPAFALSVYRFLFFSFAELILEIRLAGIICCFLISTCHLLGFDSPGIGGVAGLYVFVAFLRLDDIFAAGV